MDSFTLDKVTAGDFQPYLGTSFEALNEAFDHPPITLMLSEATSVEEGVRPFALVFEGPPDVALPQGIYRLAHSAIQGLSIFLVPISGEARCRRYEAVFN